MSCKNTLGPTGNTASSARRSKQPRSKVLRTKAEQLTHLLTNVKVCAMVRPVLLAGLAAHEEEAAGNLLEVCRCNQSKMRKDAKLLLPGIKNSHKNCNPQLP